MIGYASRTGTRRNLAALAAAGWGLLISPCGVQRDEGFARTCVDNIAWPFYQAGRTPDDAALEEIFLPTLRAFGPRADFAVVPDIVRGGAASLALSRRWLPRVLDLAPRGLIAVQDGMTADDVADLVGPRVGVFVGGSGGEGGGPNWKEESLPIWRELRRQTGCWLHVGRVNSARRIALCHAAGATSFDGTSVSRFASTLPRLENARRQEDLLA